MLNKESAWITLFHARNRLRFKDIVACRLLWEAEDALMAGRAIDLSRVNFSLDACKDGV